MKSTFSIILFLIVFTACKDQPAATKEASEKLVSSVEIQLSAAQIKTGGIETDLVKIAAINTTVTLNGVIDVPPQNMVSITCPLGGYIKSINLLPGQEISKGEVLITMEDPAYIKLQEDYLVGKSNIQYLEKENERQRTLAATEAASQKSFQQVTAQYQAQLIGLMALKEKLALIGIDAEKLSSNNISRMIGIRSPIHGFISKVPVNKGRYVSPTEIMAELVDPGDIHASLTVFEKDISLLKANQSVRIKLITNPEIEYPAEVLLVSRNIDESRSGLVHCHFHKYFRELVPGMAVSALVETGEHVMPLVPEEAIVSANGKHYVFVEGESNAYKLTEIIAGEKENGMVALTNNNIDWKGKRVVTKGSFRVLGMLLKAEESKQ